METNHFIGIDPDSQKLVCCLIKPAGKKSEKTFPYTHDGLTAFLKWQSGYKNMFVAIEGRGGYSTSFEQFMSAKNITFYTVPSGLVHSSRTTGPMRHKSNSLDAQAVAELIMMLHHKKNLEQYIFVARKYDALKIQTRTLDRLNKKMRAEYNQLWQMLGYISNDIRLYICGDHKDFNSCNRLANAGVLRLFTKFPDPTTWLEKSDNELHEAMGLGCLEKRKTFLADLRKLAINVTEQMDPVTLLSFSHTADNVLRGYKQREAIEKAMQQQYGEDIHIKSLTAKRGIGISLATNIVAEIETIERFANDDKLASYAGLGRRQYSTGANNREIKSTFFNHRLKNAFMQAAHSLVFHKGDTHLIKYFEHLRKHFGANEAYKRVARALVRTVFRLLKDNEKKIGSKAA